MTETPIFDAVCEDVLDVRPLLGADWSFETWKARFDSEWPGRWDDKCREVSAAKIAAKPRARKTAAKKTAGSPEGGKTPNLRAVSAEFEG
jgi:hypothetical protein